MNGNVSANLAAVSRTAPAAGGPPAARAGTPRLPVSPLAAGATIPLAFIATGFAAGAIGTAWLALAPAMLALPHVHPQVVALAHVWLLGCLLTICCGAIYQLLPVLANVPFAGRRQAWTHLALHAAGVALMVPAFASARMGLVAAGGMLVAAGVVLLSVAVARVLRATTRLDPILLAFGAATAWLLVTVAVGVLLAANLHFGWFGVDVLAVLRAHAHLGVGGFFVTLLQGALFRLVPMFTLGELRGTRRVGVALAASQLGLLVLVPALGLGRTRGVLAGAALLAGSFVLTAFELRRVWATRRKRALEPGLRGFFLGLGALGLAALLGTALTATEGNVRAALAYGVLAVIGGVLAAVEGMLCKIVPFLVWMRVYGPRVGRQPTPAAAALGSPRCERAWVVLHAAGALLLAAGAAAGETRLLAAGAWALAAGQISLGASLAQVARHLWRPMILTKANP